MKYFVITRHWDDSKHDIVKRIAGSFDRFFDAALFRDAYNEHYRANAEIVEAFSLVNN